MPRKKLDSRIRTLIEKGVRERHRTLFVIVGDRAREQVVNLHYMLSRAQVRARPNVLWCYKKTLGFNSTVVAMRAADPRRRNKRQWSSAGSGATASAAFNEFIATTEIRYVYYSDTHRVLGQTYGMLVLQDFEALTPNLLARTVETVAGGGIVCLLLRTMDSLRQLHALAMDAHKRFRPSGANSAEPVARFNERFLLSLATCDTCLVVDDELDVLPISSRVRAALESDDAAASAHNRTALPYDDIEDDEEEGGEDSSGDTGSGSTGSGNTRRAEARVVVVEESRELRELKESLHDFVPAGPLIRLATTVDQARAALLFLDTITEKSLRTTVSLTAARGRGKSAALGIAIAGAVATGYSNIFVTAPSPENLKTLFDFVLRGFDALGYREHADYDIIQATNPELGKCVVRLNIYRAHRQTVQYIAPSDASKLGQAELLVIDEAAAIPLPYVQALLGPYLVFLSSTVNGYEGTGRSLSLKLVQKLREQSKGADNTGSNTSSTKANTGSSAGAAAAAAASKGAGADASQASGRVLRELVLEEPIRYAAGDPVEKWLNALLCLDAASPKALPPLTGGFPHPSECQLFYVSRDTLFSFHRQSEEFLQRIMALFVSSHYKNSPNDLQLMSDAPAHHIFVLLGPVRDTTKIPDVLAAIHVSLEGAISREAVMLTTGRGQKAAGDLIPWTVSQQFQDNDFPALSGARFVRIATHPAMQGMGYGSRALQLLGQYYQGEITSLDEDFVEEQTAIAPDEDDTAAEGSNDTEDDHHSSRLLTEKIEPRKGLPPLLVPLQQRRPERLHWLGVAFGISTGLYNFWSANGYRPVYVRLTSNEITGEHSCIMMARIDTPVNARSDTDEFRSVLSTDRHWLDHFVADFRKRFAALLEYDFADMPVALPTSVLVPDVVAASKDPGLCTKARDDADGDHTSSSSSSSSDAAGEPGAKRARLELTTADDYDRLGVPLARREIHQYFTPYDLKRLDSYAANLVDYHVVLDLVPLVARLVFTGRVPVGFSAHQYSTLVGVGLQHKRIEAVARDLGIEVNQLLANFNKAMRKVTAWLRQTAEQEVESELSLADSAAAAAAAAASSAPIAAGADPRLAQTTLDEDLDTAAKASLRKLAGAGKKRAAGPTVLDPQTGATSAEAAAKMEDADAQDDDVLANGESEAEKQERLARRLGVSWYKINNGDVLDQAISKLHTAIPNFVSFKVREKDVTKKTKKNQAVFERDSKHKKHSRGGGRGRR